jgi:hypothetical protein
MKFRILKITTIVCSIESSTCFMLVDKPVLGYVFGAIATLALCELVNMYITLER